MPPLQQLAGRLARAHGRAHCLLTGNATTALYLALKAAGLRGRHVAIPNGVCVNVPLAVLLSGNTPFYLDIDRATLGIAPAELERHAGSFDAVVAVHAYGAVCDIDAIAGFCRARGLPLTEDVAAAQGAHVGTRPAGSFGDVSVLSFGAGKIIDLEYGGAALTDDAALYREMARVAAGLPNFEAVDHAQADELSRRHTALYNERVSQGYAGCAAEFRPLALAAGAAFLFRFPGQVAESALRALADLPANLARRAERARWFAQFFRQAGSPLLETFEPPAGSTWWRFNLFVEHGRDGLLRRLLQQRFKVSSWFPPVDLFLERGTPRLWDTPVADRVGDTIVNLWVSDDVDDAYGSLIANAILDFTGRRLRNIQGI